MSGGRYDLIVQDANECEVSQSTNFTAFTGVQLELPTSVRINPSATYQLPLQINLVDSLIEKIEWTPTEGLSCSDCAQPILNNKYTEIYRVAVTDKNGCTAQKSINIEVITPSDVYLPSAFSPNQDGQNDIFQVHANAQNIRKINRLNVYDRYGNLVFSRVDFLPNNPTNGWDGRFKGEEMPEGVYIYWAEVELTNNQLEILGGEISLIR